MNVSSELHVDRQELTDQQNLVFDPRSCQGLANSLRALNTSHNRIVGLEPLQECKRLAVLDVSGNKLQDLE